MSVARPTLWGNPFTVEEFGLELALRLYERSVQGIWSSTDIPVHLVSRAYAIHTAYRARIANSDVRELRGWNLACWCKEDRQCHVDILLRLANECGRHDILLPGQHLLQVPQVTASGL